jgi:muconolactone delta-isomerase
MDEAADEIDRLREALRQLLTVMPVFPDAAKKIVGMEDRYNAAITNARDALRESDA